MEDGLDGPLGVTGVDNFMSVTNRSKLAMARKQNFAGVVKGKRIGRIWGVPVTLLANENPD